MRGLKRWHRGATFAALFALLLQAALSFGHVHNEPAGAHVAAGQPDRFCGLPEEDHDRDGHANGLCAICVTIKLLGHSFAASPPALHVRQAHFASPPCRTSATPAQGRAAAFRSRAPPLV
jgi:hypothetical protein